MNAKKATASAFTSRTCRLSFLGVAAINGLLLLQSVEARNIAITSKAIAVATRSPEVGLSTFDAPRGRQEDHSILMVGGRTFDDVVIDPFATDKKQFVFAISFASRKICSLRLMNEGGYFLAPIGCTSTEVSVSPYTGISAMNGTLVVSGGTGGLSVFTYDTKSGFIDDPPAVLDHKFPGVISHPDVTMITPTLAALSSDFTTSSRYGTLIASIDSNSTVKKIRDFFAPSFVHPVNDIYYDPSGEIFMFTANGPITVQDPTKDGNASVVESAPEGFEALTVAVNSEKKRVLFGGILNGVDSILVLMDITMPLAPVLINSTVVESGGEISSDFSTRPIRLISSLETRGNFVVYSLGGELGMIEIEGGIEAVSQKQNPTLRARRVT